MGSTNTFKKAGGLLAAQANRKVAQIVVDFSKETVVADDTVNLWTIPAGCYIEAVTAQVVTAEGGTLTFDVGDAASAADDYIDGANGNSAAWLMGDGGDGTTATTTVHSLYTAASILTLTPKNDADTAKIVVHVLYYDPTGASNNV